MPRVTYRDRLETLISNPAISSRDKTFAQSLLAYYNRRRSMTAGRARCVRQLEERYSAENIAAAKARGGAMLERLKSLESRTEENSWGRGFVESLISQVSTGRKLSDRQLQILKKIEKEHDAESMAARDRFAADYAADKDGMKSDALVVAAYYAPTGYFSHFCNKIKQDRDYIPRPGEYNKVVKNKYAQKVLREHHAPAKYAVGSFVRPRSGAPYALYRALNGKPAIVIQTDAGAITSACKGAKKYRLLPIGGSETVMVEERHIKNGKV